MHSIQGQSWRSVVKNVYVFGILAIFFIVFTAINPKFIAGPSLSFIIQTVAPLLVVSLPATLLMISGNIDLSVGSILAFSGVIMATLSKGGMAAWEAVLIAAVLGLGVGWINGLLVSHLKITSVIATLVMNYVLLGVAKILTGDTIPYVKGVQSDFNVIGRGKVGGLPVATFFILAAIIIFIVLQKKSVLGKYSFAIGGNRDASILSGINAGRLVWLLYVITGAAAAVGGCLSASKMGVADATSGAGFELDVIIAILIGGTSFAGGEGSVIRSIVGAFIVSVLTIGLNMAGVESFYQYVVKGAVLIAAVYLDKIIKEKVST
ncbi:MAG: ABC transporter permease [Clostridiales Family XIII bacterium]|jgi:ribose/xylose/arabinose/galactoside ABC-type transport system permease subunit|nr:ABC transporter permease [Clostridiales Family XIII bacterium]